MGGSTGVLPGLLPGNITYLRVPNSFV
jgi:hypothetical protein